MLSALKNNVNLGAEQIPSAKTVENSIARQPILARQKRPALPSTILCIRSESPFGGGGTPVYVTENPDLEHRFRSFHRAATTRHPRQNRVEPPFCFPISSRFLTSLLMPLVAGVLVSYSPPMDFAYITNGKLYVARAGAPTHGVVSEFADQVMRRHQKSVEKGQWKSPRAGAGVADYDLWNNGRGPELDPENLVKFLSVAASPDPRFLYYTLRTESVGGLFRYDLEEGAERRIFHKENLEISDIQHHPDRDELVCSVRDGAGSSLAIVSNERFDLEFVTEGDSYDLAPSWIPGSTDEIVFQSAGIGRHQSGVVVAIGPAAVVRLNLKTGRQETLLEDPAHDFLAPRFDSQGNLFCIRRPYEPAGRRVSHSEALKDFFLMPYRLLKAIFGFLNLISQVFGKQALSNAATGQRNDLDVKSVYLKGRLLNLRHQKASTGDPDRDHPSLVPPDWELICRTPDGKIQVLDKRVGDYTLKASGLCIYTDGYQVFQASPGASPERLHRGQEIIETVALLAV